MFDFTRHHVAITEALGQQDSLERIQLGISKWTQVSPAGRRPGANNPGIASLAFGEGRAQQPAQRIPGPADAGKNASSWQAYSE
jgi:hypothetical protein